MLKFQLKAVCTAGLIALAVVGCSSDSNQEFSTTPRVTTPAVLLNPIAAFLQPGVADDIQLDDGYQPITDGDWPRYSVDTTWNWQLLGEVNTSYEADVYVVDMFAQLSENSIESLHAMGRDVICYFSAGTYEPWRPDANLLSNFELGNPHIGFPNEFWLDVRNPEIMKLMANRMDIAVELGCDGVELDNVDAFVNDTSFDITQEDALIYTRILANEAHKRGLAVALKNNVELVNDVVDYFDLLVNEECFQYNECEGYFPIIQAGKPVFNAEYTEEHINDPVAREELCQTSRSYGFQTLFLPLVLDGSFRLSCR